MIRIDRGAEPPALAEIREFERTRVRAALADGAELSQALVGTHYEGPNGVFRQLLWERQSFKCGWCEHQHELRNRDVEHFRPKVEAKGRDGIRRSGYWWLAWSWENLFFSCDNCNRYEKNSYFPLEDESHRLLPEEHPPGRERPLLVDPGNPWGDPIDHIRFVPDAQRPFGWRPVPRGGSRSGAVTIRALGLDRDALLGFYAAHARERSDAVGLLGTWARERAVDFSVRWYGFCARHLRAFSTFPALNHDMLDHAVPATLRRHLGVTLPRPPYQPG